MLSSPDAPKRGQVSPLVGGTVMYVGHKRGDRWSLEIGFDCEHARAAMAAFEAHHRKLLAHHCDGPGGPDDGADPPAAKRPRTQGLRYISCFEEREHPRLRDLVKCVFHQKSSKLWRGPDKTPDMFSNLAVGTPCYVWLQCSGMALDRAGGTAAMQLGVAHLWADAPLWERFPFATPLEVQGALPQSHRQQPPPAAELRVPSAQDAERQRLYQRGAHDRRGRWLQEHIRFSVEGEVLSDDYGKMEVALREADLGPLRALDALQRGAAGAGASFVSLLRQRGEVWSMQAKLHLDGQDPPTRFWRTEHTPWSLPDDARLWRYRELEAGRDPFRLDAMADREQRAVLAAFHPGGGPEGRPAVRRAAMHEMVGKRIRAVLDVRGYWVWSKSRDQPPLAGHRIHFEHVWIQDTQDGVHQPGHDAPSTRAPSCWAPSGRATCAGGPERVHQSA